MDNQIFDEVDVSKGMELGCVGCEKELIWNTGDNMDLGLIADCCDKVYYLMATKVEVYCEVDEDIEYDVECKI